MIETNETGVPSGTMIACIACGKEIKAIHHADGEAMHIGMWFGGTVDKVVSGYGSKYDCIAFTVGICDECMANALANGSAIRWSERP